MSTALTRLFVTVLMGLVALVATSPAAGYCRKTTASDASEASDPARSGKCDPAPESALPLYWTKACVEYRIVVDPELEAQGKMTSARASEIVHRAAGAWAAVQCSSAAGGTRPVSIQTVDVAQGRCAGARGTTRNEVHFTTDPSDGDGLAITNMTFDAQNGGLFTAVTRVADVYAELGATPAEVDAHVEYVVRHEMGHFLGLAHSERTDAVMNATFRSRAADGLTEDDVRGLCDAYSPDAPVGAGCAIASDRRADARVAWGALLALLAVARRRRTSTRSINAVLRLLLVLVALLPSTAQAGGPSRKPKARPTTTNAKGTSNGPAKSPAKSPRTMARTSAAASTRAPADPTDDELIHHTPTTIPVAPTTTAAGSSLPEVLPVTTTAATPTASSDPDHAPAPPRTTDVYVGGAYRAFVLPRAFVGVVGRANKDPIFHAASVEARFQGKSGLSLVPALTFADLSTGDMLIGSRSADRASSFSHVRSELQAVAASVELVWSLPVSPRVELELGLELGVGVTFGRLVDNWVFETPNGPLEYGGRRFAPCRTVNDGVGCRPQDHGSPTPVRVGDYTERGIFAGGSAPTLLPWVSLPLVGVRTRITDDVALRIGVGASATGIWAGASLGYAVARRSSP